MTETPPFISSDIEDALSWKDAVNAIIEGHRRPRAQLGDTLLKTEAGEILTRSATISGMGAGVKAATINMQNPSCSPRLPAVQGAFFLFEPITGALSAIIEGAVLTRWKTVSDSLAGASIFAQPDPTNLTVVGTGFIANALIEGYKAFFPSITAISVWGRSQEKAANLAAQHEGAKSISDLCEAVADADIVTSATASTTPLIPGAAIKYGAHVDLIGAYGPLMREADDELLTRSRIFVDCIDTTVDHIGEILIPIREGVIARNDIEGDLYDNTASNSFQRNDDDITLYKNGGGAHLDLMIARYFVDTVNRVRRR